MSVNCKNQHIASFKLSSKAGRASQKGGVRYGVNNSTLSKGASLGMGKGYSISSTSSTCGGKANPSNLGAATIRGGGKPYSNFNNLRSSAYGFTSKGAAMAKTFRGSYAAPSEIRRSQCGGKRTRKRRRRRKRGGIQAGITGKIKKMSGSDCKKSMLGSECAKGLICKPPSKTAGNYGTCQVGKSIAGRFGLGGKSRRRKSRRKRRRTKRRKSRRKRTKRKKSRRRKRQRGGNKWSQAGSNKALSYRYSMPAKVNMPWALGPHSRTVTSITN